MGSESLLGGLAVMGVLYTVASKGWPSRYPLIHFSSNPAVITVKKHKGSDEVERISLRTLVETRCKSLFTEFRPLWWLFKYVVRSLLPPQLLQFFVLLQRSSPDHVLRLWRLLQD